MVDQNQRLQSPCLSDSPYLHGSVESGLGCVVGKALFAFRVARLASKPTVHCFEPFAPMGQCLLKAAAINHLEHRIVLHTNAVGKTNGHVRFSSSHSPDSGEVHECEHEHPQALPCVTVDQFLEDQGITMNQNDLIKIDAEGADFEVLLGRKRLFQGFIHRLP